MKDVYPCRPRQNLTSSHFGNAKFLVLDDKRVERSETGKPQNVSLHFGAQLWLTCRLSLLDVYVCLGVLSQPIFLEGSSSLSCSLLQFLFAVVTLDSVVEQCCIWDLAYCLMSGLVCLLVDRHCLHNCSLVSVIWCPRVCKSWKQVRAIAIFFLMQFLCAGCTGTKLC